MGGKDFYQHARGRFVIARIGSIYSSSHPPPFGDQTGRACAEERHRGGFGNFWLPHIHNKSGSGAFGAHDIERAGGIV